jgi:hypothetical protein
MRMSLIELVEDEKKEKGGETWLLYRPIGRR